MRESNAYAPLQVLPVQPSKHEQLQFSAIPFTQMGHEPFKLM